MPVVRTFGHTLKLPPKNLLVSECTALYRVQLSLSELKIHNCTRMHLKSNALAKGGTLKAILSEVAITRAIHLSSAWAMARKPDEIKDLRRAATAPTRNAVEIPLLRRRGAAHRSA